MNKVVLYAEDVTFPFSYINYLRVEMFEDETISVTSKIQDIRDISKVFTDFSQSFTVPASKTNNKIFRHFYNYNIVGGEFDARRKIKAKIEINNIPFRDGKIFLNGVKMKNNKPYAYNLTFFGNTVTLKDLFNDDKLESLTWLDNFTHQWDNSTVRDGFQYGLSPTVDSVSRPQAIIYPLITHTKRLFYDSGAEGGDHDLSGNIYYHVGHTHTDTGIEFDDLKPAIKAIHIIEAIEDKYGIEFTREFFGSDVFSKGNYQGALYLWLSRQKGSLGEGTPETPIGGFSYASGTSLSNFSGNNEGTAPNFKQSGGTSNTVLEVEPRKGYSHRDRDYLKYYTLKLTVTPESGSASQQYSIKIIDRLQDDKVLQQWSGLSGTEDIYFYLTTKTRDQIFELQWVVVTDTGFEAESQLEIKERFNTFDGTGDHYSTGYYDSSTISTVVDLIPTRQMPDMKVYDFLTGIFKMFNLTAYYIDDRNDADYGKIRVLPLDDFYSDNPKTFDITKYVDSSETDVEATMPFSDIQFKYKEGKTLLMLKHKELFNEDFGDAEYTPKDIDRGKPYKIELPFEHMKFERLEDSDTGDLTQIQWGYSAGDNFKPDADVDPKTANYDSTLTKPVLFYGLPKTSGSNYISWKTPTSTQITLYYYAPSNSIEFGTTPNDPQRTGTATSTSSFKLIDESLGSPFYNVRVNDFVIKKSTLEETVVTSVVSYYEIGVQDDIFVSGDEYIIYRPPAYTLNFDPEQDEWTRTDYGIESNTLFSRFYENYVVDAFNPRKRIFKLTAHLPNSVLLNYKLNDRFKIGDKVFTINSINTNLKTGESKLELLNVL
jgi:hypothetical protein